jgi:hypothetical protein
MSETTSRSATGSLSMWTIYDHPSDYPNTYIARRAEIGRGVIVHTTDTILDQDLEKLRAQLSLRGLVCLTRDPGDDPKIIEVWL